ncbi:MULTISPECIES: helix-turn-helix domain-containing protein [Myroides]|uniref:Helix-turn-helix domain-containing protein n=1 Tax=Myroides albus TaxID=2562892 RepID=A0A6I3LPF3_9FLAO|nr:MULTISPECIES: AraC family transcriptional regulator [Myroides]MTG99306.1 helix-turn-helix domain-containing protein [Myroides albus]MVX36735.1 helix-turn-helix domain-containing protein [Myroides sp. LoEW2-1]UVD79993.1 AraC family transcriptional regulator [Myroides albus]
MEIKYFTPCTSLEKYIKKFWYGDVLSEADSISKYKILAAGSTGLIIQHCRGKSNLFNYTDQRQLPIAFLYGQKSDEPCVNYFKTHGSIIGIDFHASAFKKIFNVNTNELTNTLIEAQELIPISIIEQVVYSSSILSAVSILEDYFIQKIQLSYSNTFIVDQGLMLLNQDFLHTDSRTIACDLHISQRQVQRKFREDIGLSIEEYKRVVKFQHACNAIYKGDFTKLSDLAYNYGYADQSHFIREFKMFSGSTPKDFLNHCIAFDTEQTVEQPMRIVGVR